MTKTRIHVNQHIIKSNKKSSKKLDPLTVKSSKSNIKASQVFLRGPSRVIYSPNKPLPCGATCWVETESDVECSENQKFCRTPDVQASFYFDGIGYQLDILHEGKMYTSVCRDFGGKSTIKKCIQQTTQLLEKLTEELRKLN